MFFWASGAWPRLRLAWWFRLGFRVASWFCSGLGALCLGVLCWSSALVCALVRLSFGLVLLSCVCVCVCLVVWVCAFALSVFLVFVCLALVFASALVAVSVSGFWGRCLVSSGFGLVFASAFVAVSLFGFCFRLCLLLRLSWWSGRGSRLGRFSAPPASRVADVVEG